MIPVKFIFIELERSLIQILRVEKNIYLNFAEKTMNWN